MGEYAKRKSDGQEVKIGTCESMLYLRFDNKDDVSPLPNNLNPATTRGLFFRLPFPDEDAVMIGEYKNHARGLRLYKMEKDHLDREYPVSFKDETTTESAGVMQLSNDAGLLVNVKCYHGEKLPASTQDVQCHWNGKSWFYELTSVKWHDDGKLWPVVSCRFCGHMWRYEWDEILPYVNDKQMKERLEKYRTMEVI